MILAFAKWCARATTFLGWYIKESLQANLRVLKTILVTGSQGTQAVTECRTRCQTEVEISALAVLWMLTPGTLVLATRRDNETGFWNICVHDIYAVNAEQAKQHVQAIESRLLPVIKPISSTIHKLKEAK